jgi:hypothetical protein
MHEEMFHVLSHKGKANQNYAEIPCHLLEWQSSRKQVQEGLWGKRNLHTVLVGM